MSLFEISTKNMYVQWTTGLADTVLAETTILADKLYKKLGTGRGAPLASPIRFDPLGFIHGPYPIPRYPIDP